jgi:hypothetical protein
METHRAHPLPQRVHDVKQTRILYFLGVLIVAAIGLLVTMLVVRGGDKKVALPKSGGPTAVSDAQLKTVAANTSHPVYWAGPKHGAYELTQTTDGRIYVRYLPSTNKVGDRAAKYLTVGTYPEKHAFRSIQRAGQRPGAVTLKLEHGGLLVFNQATPKSVYFGYPGANYQVEVYDPSPQRARTLALAGQIKPIK